MACLTLVTMSEGSLELPTALLSSTMSSFCRSACFSRAAFRLVTYVAWCLSWWICAGQVEFSVAGVIAGYQQSGQASSADQA